MGAIEHLLGYLPTYLSTYLLTYLPTYLLTYLPTYLLTYLPTYLLTYQEWFTSWLSTYQSINQLLIYSLDSIDCAPKWSLVPTSCRSQRLLQRAGCCNQLEFFYFYCNGLQQSLVAADLQLVWTRLEKRIPHGLSSSQFRPTLSS